jgi:hypothetical protein
MRQGRRLPGGSQQGPAAGPAVPQVSASTARPGGVAENWFARDPKVTSWWTQQSGGRTLSGALNSGDKVADLGGRNVSMAELQADALGRRGTAVTLTDAPTSQGAVLQSWLIIDPRTSAALAQESHVVKAAGQQAGLAPGTRWYSAVVQSSGWTDQAPPR